MSQRMTTERESDQPNEEGFAGDPTTPQPEPIEPIEKVDGESIAVPAGDLTRPITETLEGLGGRNDDSDE
jgi:hypothetical protein